MDTNLIERILELAQICSPVLVATFRCPSLVHKCAARLQAHQRLAALVFLRDMMRALSSPAPAEGTAAASAAIAGSPAAAAAAAGAGAPGTAASSLLLSSSASGAAATTATPLLQQFRVALCGGLTNVCPPDQDEGFGLGRHTTRGLVHGDVGPLRNLFKAHPHLVKFFAASLLVSGESGDAKYATSEKEVKQQIAALQYTWRGQHTRDLLIGSDEEDSGASIDCSSSSNTGGGSAPRAAAEDGASADGTGAETGSAQEEHETASSSQTAAADENKEQHSEASPVFHITTPNSRTVPDRLRRIAGNMAARLPRPSHLEVDKSAVPLGSKDHHQQNASSSSPVLAAIAASQQQHQQQHPPTVVSPSAASPVSPRPPAAPHQLDTTMATTPRPTTTTTATSMPSTAAGTANVMGSSTGSSNMNGTTVTAHRTPPEPHYEMPSLAGSVDALYLFLLEYPHFAASPCELRVTARDALISLNALWILGHPTIDEEVVFVPPLPSSESPESVSTSTSTLATRPDETSSPSRGPATAPGGDGGQHEKREREEEEEEETGARAIQRAVNVNARNIVRQLRKQNPVDQRAPAHILEDEPWHLWQDISAYDRYERSVLSQTESQKRAAAYGGDISSNAHLRRAINDEKALDAALKLSAERPLEDRVRFLLELNLATQSKVPEDNWRSMLRVLDKTILHMRKSRPLFEGAALQKDRVGAAALELTDRCLAKTTIPSPALRPHELGQRIADFAMTVLGDFSAQVAEKFGLHQIFAAPGEAAAAAAAAAASAGKGSKGGAAAAAEESEMVQTLRQLITVLKWAAKECQRLAQDAKSAAGQ